MAVHRGRYEISLLPPHCDKGSPKSSNTPDKNYSPGNTTITGMRASYLRRTSLVPGDIVSVDGDTSGEPGTLGRIMHLHDRTTVLRRSADDLDNSERVIVANAEQLLVVVATQNPEPDFSLIDRALVGAYDAGITPLLLVTKTDLAPPDAIYKYYSSAQVKFLTTGFDASGTCDTSTVREAITGRTTVLLGASGVGKSTLMNALVPQAKRATGEVNAITGQGRHTSSSAVAWHIPEASAWVIDTPGVRSFGLAHSEPHQIIAAFPEFAEVDQLCPKNCAHGSDTIGCHLDTWVHEENAGAAGKERLASLRQILNHSTPYWQH